MKGYHKLYLEASSRHILSIPIEQFLRGNQFGLAVAVPALLARLATAHNLTQFRGRSFIELLDSLQAGWRKLRI